MSISDHSFPSFSPDDHLLLFGCTGLFGQHLLPRLKIYLDSTSEPPLISLVTRSRQNTLQKFPFLSSINIVEADFLSTSSLSLPRAPSYILHMANVSALDTFNGQTQYAKYLLLVNSVNALRSLVKPGITKKIIFTSSGVAYGHCDEYCESDKSVLNVLDPSYSLGFAKLSAEYLLSMLCSEVGASLVVCRCFSFISPYLPYDLHYALGNFVHSAVRGDDIVIRGDGMDLRSYQHVDDAIDWLLALFDLDLDFSLINFGSDESLSIKDLAFLIRDLVAPALSIEILNQPADPHNFRRHKYVPSLYRSRLLGLSNRRTLNDSIVELAKSILNLN